jgi:hypothetical protein
MEILLAHRHDFSGSMAGPFTGYHLYSSNELLVCQVKYIEQRNGEFLYYISYKSEAKVYRKDRLSRSWKAQN